MEKVIKLLERDLDSKEFDRCELEVEEDGRGSVCLWSEGHHLVTQIPFDQIGELEDFIFLLEKMIKTYKKLVEED